MEITTPHPKINPGDTVTFTIHMDHPVYDLIPALNYGVLVLFPSCVTPSTSVKSEHLLPFIL